MGRSSIDQISYYNAQKYSSINRLNKIGPMHGVQRVVVFCIMTAVLPTTLIITPLYLRHSVFGDVTYPVAESDVLAIKEGVSTIFCQALSLRMNSSFNAFQLIGTPQLSSKRKHIRLKKSMTLPDDTLEYWGFYLLQGAMVKLKVCSRYQGSRLLVVRGEKNLKTCGLLDHNLMKFGAKFDTEHSRVKVTYENPAEVIGLVDDENLDVDNASEDFTPEEKVDIFVRKRIEKGKARNKINSTSSEKLNVTRHHKRHESGNHPLELESLKKVLDNEGEEGREKRSVAELDAKIKHGGNAYNNTDTGSNDENSVSSFETDLLICYDGQILLTEGFSPSHLCNDVTYLEQSNHMVTTHEVASDGYYYYIFYSDNDYVMNDIHAIFDIYKPTYRYANSSNLNECINSTNCNFPLSFMSDEIVIVEVPTRDGIEHEEDDITLLTSTCHPRTAIYMIFPILVLLLILGCAFL